VVSEEDCHDALSCDAMSSVFALLGKRWSGIIMSTLISGPARFSELGRQVAGVSERMLSNRLTELIAAGLVERQVLEGPPVGVLYQVTPKGAALRPALDELQRWAEQNLGELAGQTGDGDGKGADDEPRRDARPRSGARNR
jgi:DNA-binding HxlR family transcriptional regulator